MAPGQLSFFAGPADDVALRAYARSLGLTLLNPHAYRMSAEENERSFLNPVQGGYFSFLPVEQLHRHPHPNIGFCDVLDPLILYIRPHYTPPRLVAGHLRWQTDVRELAAETKPYFQKVRNWVRDNWRPDNQPGGFFIGPEADRLIAQEGAQPADFSPGVTTRQIPIP